MVKEIAKIIDIIIHLILLKRIRGELMNTIWQGKGQFASRKKKENYYIILNNK